MFKITNFIFCRFNDVNMVNDNKMVFVTLNWLFVKQSHI